MGIPPFSSCYLGTQHGDEVALNLCEELHGLLSLSVLALNKGCILHCDSIHSIRQYLAEKR